MRLILGFAALAGLLACGNAEAAVDGVVTSSTATVTFKPDPGGNANVYNFSGDQISGNLGDNLFGSGANFASTSEMKPNLISFENGNASAGEYAYVSSKTDVKITFTNDSDSPVLPRLRSEIIPAGLGVYVGNPCLASLTNCTESTGVNFQNFVPDGSDYKLAGALVDFKILSGDVTIYDLSVSFDMMHDPVSNQNFFVDNIGQGQSTLNGFRLETPEGSSTQYGFNWLATTVDVAFPGDSLLLPGQSGALTYETTVSSYSRASCVGSPNAFGSGCLIAYSAFGDPIGGTPGIKPSASVSGFGLLPADDGQIQNLAFGQFGFSYPTFSNGVLTYILAPVPEPSSWVLAICGVGLLGAALRRQHRNALNEGATPTTG